MMKKLFITVVCLLTTFGCFAQFSTGTEILDRNHLQPNSGADKYVVVTNSFWSDWFISVGGGAALYFGDQASNMKLIDRPFGTFKLSIGKWFTPGIGVRFNGQMFFVKTSSTTQAHSVGWYDESMGLYKQKFDAFNVGSDLMFNVSDLFFGYNSKRFYNLIPYAGVGIIFTRNKPRDDEMSLSAGLLNTFRLGSNLDLNLDICGMMFDDRFNGDALGNKNDGMFSVSLGLTYKLGSKSRIGWAHDHSACGSSSCYTEAQMADIRNKMNALQSQNALLSEHLAQSKVDTMVVKGADREEIAPVMIVFHIGRATLSQDMRVNLGFFAQQLKSSKTKCRYIITGYTDKSGGIVINEKLANKRAFAVFDCLTREFGVDRSLLKMDYKIGVNNMFYSNPALSRVAIIRAEK